MKLDKLWIADFKNLRDFSIDFDESSLTTVLVGRNGTGKSNLLEAIILIFRDLDLGNPPPFRYELDYLCRGMKIHVSSDPNRTSGRVKVTIDGASVSYQQFSQGEARSFLPRYVFGYYSGPSNRMEAHFQEHQSRFYRDLIGGNGETPQRPLFYARLVHSQFVLLAFFTEQDSEILHILDELLWIEGLDHVLFVARQPPWKSNEGDPRFWHARGHVARFLGRLYEVALAPMRLPQRVQLGFNKSATLEHLFLYLSGEEELRQLANIYSSQHEFFKALESTYISELLSEVRIRVRLRKSDGSLTYGELSEGEQQLLMVLGLLRFTKEDEALFLLDEPDTHLNPAWSLRYLDLLETVVGEHSTSHVIMTTHDPLTIAGLEKAQVQIMERDEASGKVTARCPEQDPRGMGIGALLTSDIYGLRSQLDLHTLQLLDRKRELAIRDTLSDEEAEELRSLNEQLGSLDFTQSARDPLYGAFVEAMTAAERSHGLQQSDLSEEERILRRQLASNILSRLKAEEFPET